ncbi:MAG: hypothetical protein Q8R26_02515 [bacterium]|nr:hypothetical protein [bacterium]
MAKYIGLILLVLAIVGGLYVASNYTDLIHLKLSVPLIVQPVTLPEVGVNYELGVTTIESRQVVKSVRISAVRLPSIFHDYFEIVLTSNLSSQQAVDVTGWTIKTDGGTYRIPQAQEVPSFNRILSNIRLLSRDTLTISSGRAIDGNFRLNKCTGYMEVSSNFIPALPLQCPNISYEERDSLTAQCDNYMRSLSACEVPSSSPPIRSDDYACFDLLRTMNYNGCVAKFRNDSDFFNNEWRVWADNGISSLHPNHDNVRLIDNNGTIVDTYKY